MLKEAVLSSIIPPTQLLQICPQSVSSIRFISQGSIQKSHFVVVFCNPLVHKGRTISNTASTKFQPLQHQLAPRNQKREYLYIEEGIGNRWLAEVVQLKPKAVSLNNGLNRNTLFKQAKNANTNDKSRTTVNDLGTLENMEKYEPEDVPCSSIGWMFSDATSRLARNPTKSTTRTQCHKWKRIPATR